MEPLTLPSYEFRTTEQDGKRQIYDPLRQTYVRLTPEEWVRQHFVQYLIQELGVPAGLVATESTFRYQGQPWRADVVVHDRQGDPLLLVHDRQGDPLLLVECKAPSVSIRQDAFDQGARYNLVLDAPYLVVTNGQAHYACRVDTESGDYAFLDDLPDYETLLEGAS